MALIPPFYLDSVVSLEACVDKQKQKYEPIATGVLLGLWTKQVDNNGNKLYRTFIVTNEHVVKDIDELWTRFSKGDQTTRYQIALKHQGKPTWATHDKADIAVIPVTLGELQKEGAEFAFIPEDQMLSVAEMQDLGVFAGDELFILGFPLGIAGKAKKYVIVRSGVVARLDKEIIDETGAYLADSLIFPGNSGGPVVLKPTNMAIQGTKIVSNASLIGIVASYVPYRDVAISQQTKQPRVIFEENSGLASIVPIDFVRSAINSLVKASPEDDPKPATTEQTGQDQSSVDKTKGVRKKTVRKDKESKP